MNMVGEDIQFLSSLSLCNEMMKFVSVRISFYSHPSLYGVLKLTFLPDIRGLAQDSTINRDL